METLWQDLRYAIRQFAKERGFAAIVILTLALGIGASTSIFSVADAVLLRPLPYPNPQQLVRIWEQNSNGHRINLAAANFDDFRTQNSTFSSLADYEYWLTAVSGGSEPARVNIARASQSFFQTLGVQPFRGRLFSSDEQRPHGAPAVILSYRHWERYLGGTSDFSQARLRLEGGIYPVIGVMPEGVRFPFWRGRLNFQRT